MGPAPPPPDDGQFPLVDQVLNAAREALAAVPTIVWAAAAGTATLFVLWTIVRAARRTAIPFADVLTYLAAGIATGVSAQGMWTFFDKAFDLPVLLQGALFAFIEIGMLASAVRARRNVRDSAELAKTDPLIRPSAGIDGTAVWALTTLTAVLSSLEASSWPEFLFRLVAPFVAAWLWERGMAIERQQISGLKAINWRLTPERILVRLGLAEARDRSASEVDAHRRLTRVALAAKRARALYDAGAKPKKQAAALARLDKALDRAVEYTDLARNPRTRAAMLDQITTLYGARGLLSLPAAGPWEHDDHPAILGLDRRSDAAELAAALDRNTAARAEVYPRPVATTAPSATAPRPDGDHPATGHDLSATPSTAPGGTARAGSEGRPWATVLVPWSRPQPRPVADDDDDRQPVAEPVAELVADGAVVATESRPVADRRRPDEQDKRRAIRLWVSRAKKGNIGSKRDLADWTGFSETWALGCIQEARQIMIDGGWTFDDRGTPAPPRPVADPVATTPAVNGSHATTPAGGEDR
ncbi:hypothetical protein [Spongiactinospora sp. TRM90649]|uniref:hypothetical protein n=1 Tax=Spongiactinospora sp. TRM90649 TaxID=3031114 RepID=UPI0023F65AFB|nr:hypothetical protein [Spongiactinospora sp. TRM90649]MDF5758763.1 hypothetical protein [Spongiactinospora sp. TRM90649]